MSVSGDVQASLSPHDPLVAPCMHGLRDLGTPDAVFMCGAYAADGHSDHVPGVDRSPAGTL